MIKTDNRSRLIQYLKELHLPSIRESFEEIAHQAEQESLSYDQYLLELMARECEDRRHRRIERFLRESYLPLEKRIDTFDLKRLPVKVKNQVSLLLEGFFLDKNENILAFRNPGTGKTHLLCGISQALIREGRRIYFTKCSLLVQKLLTAKRDLKLAQFIKKLNKFEAVLIDDIGYVQQSREEMEVLFTFLAERYGQNGEIGMNKKTGGGQSLNPYNIPSVGYRFPVFAMPRGSLALSCDTLVIFHQREGIVVDILV